MTRWPHRWNVLAFTLLSQALIIGIQTSSFSFWLLPWSEEFSAPRSELMLIITASIFASGAMSPFAGKALDRLQPRILFCIGIALFSLGLVLISMAGTHWLILLSYAGLLSAGVAICGQLGCQTLITRCFKSDRGMALGISSLGVSAGAILIPPLVTELLALYGWRDSFRILALATLLFLGPAAWLVLKQTSGPDRAHSEMAPSSVQPGSLTTLMLLRNPDFWIISGGFAAILVAFLPLLHSIGAFAHDIGISQQRAAFGASFAALALALGKVLFGKLADLVSHRVLYQSAMLLMAAGVTLASFADSYPQLVAGLMLASVAQGCYLPLLSSMVVSRFGAPAFGQVMGLAIIVIQCGAVGPYLSGLVRDHTGSYSTALMAMLIPLPIAMFAMRGLSESNRV